MLNCPFLFNLTKIKSIFSMDWKIINLLQNKDTFFKPNIEMYLKTSY